MLFFKNKFHNFLKELNLSQEEFSDLILKLKEKEENIKNEIININIIKKEILNDSTKNKTFNLSEEVLDDWDQFCEKNNIFQKQHLLGSALVEYMEKYNNEPKDF